MGEPVSTGDHPPAGKRRSKGPTATVAGARKRLSGGISVTKRGSQGAAAKQKPVKEPVKKAAEDVLLVVGENETGSGYNVLRQRQNRLEAGELKPLVEGKSLEGELVRLRPRKEAPALFDVDVEFAKDAPRSSTVTEAERGRPAQVASKGYRKNWSRVFGAGRKTSKTSQLN